MVSLLGYVQDATAEFAGQLLDIDSFYESFINDWMLTEFRNQHSFDAYYLSQYELFKEKLEILKMYDKTQFTLDQCITYDTVVWFLESEIESEKFLDNKYVIEYRLDYYIFPLIGFKSFVPINKAYAEFYVKYLDTFDEKFKSMFDSVKERRKRGYIPPKYVNEKTIAEMRTFVETQITDNPETNFLYLKYKKHVEKLTDLTEEEKEELCLAVKNNIGTRIYERYQDFIDFLEGLNHKAGVYPGVWQMPNGDEYYAYLLRNYTTTNLTPEEIHNIGLKEVEKIRLQMRTILDDLGYYGLDFGEAMEIPNDKNRITDPDEALTKYQEIVDYMYERIPEMFSTMPEEKVKLELRPYDLWQAAYGGGIFKISSILPHYTHVMPATAYHEAIPGHHFQLTLANNSEYFPRIRSMIRVWAYVEGWALYAEQLANEYGCYTDQESVLGYLQNQLFRAVRLVVDTGIHYKRWTREETVKYMYNMTGMSREVVEAEVDRYIVIPGQACSYKIGQIKILELREKVKNELGEKFDIKEFHEVLLKYGEMPLDVLVEEVIDKYIEFKNKI